MSLLQVYFPNDLLKYLSRRRDGSIRYLLGYKIDSIYVVVQLNDDKNFDKLKPSVSKEESIEKKSLQPSERSEESIEEESLQPSERSEEVIEKSQERSEKPDEQRKDTTENSIDDLRIIGSISTDQKISPLNQEDDYLSFYYDYERDLPCIYGDKQVTLVLFDPPNFANLEYFSIDPILLQSMGASSKQSVTETLVEKFMVSEHASNIQPVNRHSISDDVIMDKINLVLKVRSDYKKKNGKSANSIFFGLRFYHCIRTTKRALYSVIVLLQKFILILITGLNYEFYHGLSLVSSLNTFRQLDLRLRQINYFPIQFLFYYDKKFLQENSPFVKSLDLPIFNSNLNFSNSNYINLHNSLWLVFNDMLLGMTAYNLMVEHHDTIIRFLRDKLISKFLHDDLLGLILWVSKDHPAGFKLNDELGSFMGDLFVWSLNYWKYLVSDLLGVHMSSLTQRMLVTLLKVLLKCLCYMGGITFLFALINDLVLVLTVHVSAFYFTSAKIYKRLTQVLKSLFQLFRGKKYNVLRNRVDNLNNYAIEMSGNMALARESASSFEIDQLLLGTLLFMIVIFLLPTVFAFYFMFFLMRLLILVTSNLLENLQIIFNFMPLFVVLLKLKNSNRLQGGINFHFLTIHRSTNYLRLSNKSLTHNDIFINFIKLFSNSKNFKSQLIFSFINGDVISIKYRHELKFRYLMLPQNYEKTTEIQHYLR